MKDLKEQLKELPDMTNEFEITDVKGANTRMLYSGKFSCKIPNGKEQTAIAKHEAALNGPNADSLASQYRDRHHMLAYLKYTLTDYPLWWKNEDLGHNLYDPNIITAVFLKVKKFEEEWLKEIWGDEDVSE